MALIFENSLRIRTCLLHNDSSRLYHYQHIAILFSASDFALLYVTTKKSMWLINELHFVWKLKPFLKTTSEAGGLYSLGFQFLLPAGIHLPKPSRFRFTHRIPLR